MIFEDEMCSFTSSDDNKSEISTVSDIDDIEIFEEQESNISDEEFSMSDILNATSTICPIEKIKTASKTEILDSLRETGSRVLSQILTSEKNVIVFEKNIFSISDNDRSTYQQLLYETCSRISDVGRSKAPQILSLIKNRKLAYNSSTFESPMNKIKEQDDFLQNPIEVEEGIFKCRCGSKRTMSFSHQTRSGDESTTVFVKCIACGKCWTAN
jgi:DNA-directed RNA polymerase subunit M/transcription elongation factor TFIIS